MQLFMWEILVPAQVSIERPDLLFNGMPMDNPGSTEYPLEHHKKWDEYVRDIAGGLTIFRSVKGQWITATKIYKEKMIPVRIACTEEQIEKIANFTIKHYRQQTVMIVKVSDDVKFITGSYE
jgi:hypothetical protein